MPRPAVYTIQVSSKVISKTTKKTTSDDNIQITVAGQSKIVSPRNCRFNGTLNIVPRRTNIHFIDMLRQLRFSYETITMKDIMEEFNECAETESFCVQLVYEFLVCYNFNKTVDVFFEEIQNSNYSLPERHPPRKNRVERDDAMEMISSLNSGNHLQFFKSWTDLIPENIKDENEYENITVLLHTYFATLPMRIGSTKESEPVQKTEQANNEETTESAKFKKAESESDNMILEEVEEENIAEESVEKNDEESLRENKNMKEIENDETTANPTAMEMFKNYLLENKYRFSSETEYLPLFALPFIENPKDHQAYAEVFKDKWVSDLKNSLKTFLVKYSCGETVIPELVNLCKENKRLKVKYEKYDATVEESTKRYHETKAKLHKLKRDHKHLVGVATELATALENSVRGQVVDLNTTLLKCAAIFPDVFPHTYNEGMKERQERKTIQFSPLQLDIKKIKEDLTSSSMKTKLLLLQALRWYVCGLPCDERPEVAGWLQSEDLLGLSGGGLTQQWLLSPPHPLQQALARWLNLLSSLRSGRGYVAAQPSLLPLIVAAAIRPQQDPVTRDMLIACLQKLSLRKELCETMVQEGLLDWLGQEMSSMTNDYCLQYSTSLFMNLSIVAPPSFWDTRPHQTLPGLISLLKSSNHQILQFVCGSLYCLLRSDKLNIFARSINLAAELAALSSGPLKRQVEALMKLHQRVLSPSAAQITSHQCPQRELDDPEEIEPEINNNDLVKGTLSGEELLFQKYSVVFTAPCVVDREQEKPKNRSNLNLPSWAQ